MSVAFNIMKCPEKFFELNYPVKIFAIFFTKSLPKKKNDQICSYADLPVYEN